METRRQAALALGGLALMLALGQATAFAQAAAPQAKAPDDASLGMLRGRWVRPDGGYVIDIKSVGADGKLDASYANPSLLPFAKAEATRDGNLIKLSFELRAGGYNGSTYALAYDAANDVLKGVYHQAVAQQRFEVFFKRASSR
jgi:uncharacterized protein (DUF2147 family)